MKTTPFKYLLPALLALPMLLAANDGRLYGKYTKEKTIKKEFSVLSDALLKVSNSYGNLTLTSWDENRIVMEIHIKTNGNNEDRVQEKLNEINVAFEASNSMVSAKTLFDKNSGGWNWNWGRGNNVSMQVNYTIKLPVKNSIHLSNDYGAIILDRIDGHAKIDCDYGRLQIGELRGRQNQLNFDYTSKSTISFMNSGKISADYSGFSINKAGDLEINADYTQSHVEQMENLVYSTDYGNLEIGEANNVQGNGDYINVSLGTIKGSVDIEADYGSVTIDKMAASARNLDLRTDYTGVKIGYSPEYHFDFEITTEYADVKGMDSFEVSISKEKSSDRYYKGYYGQEGNGNSVRISSTYGNVNFNSN